YIDKVTNVEHRQTLFGRLLGIGDVSVDTASGAGVAVFPRISRPLEWKRAIDAAAAAYRNRGAAPAASAPAASGADKIRQLKQLLDDGLISQEEFEAKRKRLLAEL
ncbi:MAG TPA: SHOCT domain-containing protein, partial [Thermoanaerobaculia bacterium]